MLQDKLLKSRYVVPYVEPLKTEPYFFKNNILGSRLYLAQNVPSYDYANYVVYSWRYLNKNPGIKDTPRDHLKGPSQDIDLDREIDLDLDLDLDLDKKPNQAIVNPELTGTLNQIPAGIPYISFEVYKYRNEKQIDLIRPDGMFKDKVLAYKVADKVNYTVLLIE